MNKVVTNLLRNLTLLKKGINLERSGGREVLFLIHTAHLPATPDFQNTFFGDCRTYKLIYLPPVSQEHSYHNFLFLEFSKNFVES